MKKNVYIYIYNLPPVQQAEHVSVWKDAVLDMRAIRRKRDIVDHLPAYSENRRSFQVITCIHIYSE